MTVQKVCRKRQKKSPFYRDRLSDSRKKSQLFYKTTCKNHFERVVYIDEYLL